ncbi:glycosyltransferase [Parasediminibacterium sp. JCM 36343]|uniref:glycosyltransferase n=1 Tax=Parasediminibacterium sp. JCM 36343 TaxID=3374279 RepID=UPI0039784F12
MRISIALAVYNGGQYLPLLLESLRHQDTLPYELVIVDDCSTDNSWDIVSSIPSNLFPVRCYKNDTNQGVIYTFKKLITLCKGDYIAFCDQDDIWENHKISISAEKMLATENKHPNTPIAIFTDLATIDQAGNKLQASFFQHFNIQPHDLSFLDILFDNVVTGCTVMVNKLMVNKLHDMPMDVLMHDHWVALIVYSFGKFDVCYSPTILYRVHGSSVTNKDKKNKIQLFQFYLKSHKGLFIKKIAQGEAFLKVYNHLLTDADKATLSFFIKLKNTSVLKQVFTRRVSRFHKPSSIYKIYIGNGK